MELDPKHPDNVRDPYPLYRWLRENEPVHWCASLRAWVITRYDDVIEVYRQPLRFSAERFEKIDPAYASSREAVRQVAAILGQWFVFRDPPAHTRMRGLLHRTFTPTEIARLAPRISETIDALLDRVAPEGGADIIADLAFPLPAMVIAMLLGAPSADIEPLKHWSDRVASYLGGTVEPVDHFEEARAGLAEMVEYFQRLLADKRKHPADDLMTMMLAARDEAGEWTEDEVVYNCVLLLFAGHETTTNLIGNGLYHLLQRPEDMAAMAADDALLPGAVEECLRFEGPVPVALKVATETVEWHGRTIRPGQNVLPIMASANRDPRRFERPETFDIHRKIDRNLSFGHGIHFCLGAPLARLETQLVFETLGRRWRDARLVSDEPRFKPMIFFRALESLDVRFTDIQARAGSGSIRH